MATALANNFRVLLANKGVNFTSDVFKIILMADGFVFNKATHDKYADVSASELSTGNGYTAGGETLTGVSVTQDDVNNVCLITWNNISWTATSGDIGPACGAIIYDDTVTTPDADPIVGFIDFSGTYTEPDGGIAVIANIKIKI